MTATISSVVVENDIEVRRDRVANACARADGGECRLGLLQVEFVNEDEDMAEGMNLRKQRRQQQGRPRRMALMVNFIVLDRKLCYALEG